MKVVYILISVLVIAFVQQSLQDDENTISVVINRRLFGDIHYFDYPERFSSCTDIESSNVTYLVEERLCVTSNDLQKGKYQ
jgi:amino acid permease